MFPLLLCLGSREAPTPSPTQTYMYSLPNSAHPPQQAQAQVSGKPIKFVGVGEKMEALEPFYPERMATRILGMGDVITLFEKAEAAVKVRVSATSVAAVVPLLLTDLDVVS